MPPTRDTNNSRHTRLQAYASHGHRHVEGWLTDTAIALILQLGEAQGALGVTGPVCEIGVHHGRLFILLHLMARRSELSAGWDLFERQDENIDQSGAGNRSRLEANLLRHGCDLSRIRVTSENSLALTSTDVISTCGGRPRLFSVDGGHTQEVTYNDLGIAANAVADGGLIILDDFFNESWPGVAEGTCRFVREAASSLYPVAIAGNKFVFTTDRRLAAEYRERVRLEPGFYAHRSSTVFGAEVLIVTPYSPTLRRKMMRIPLVRSVLGNPRLRRLRRRLSPR